MSGKKILFIGPAFFGYEREIKDELERAGNSVQWYDERPTSAPLVKALIRFRPGLMSALSDAYFDRIIAASRGVDYDVVLVIKGEALSLERLLSLRAAQPRARFIFYVWDSLKNVKNSAPKLAHFEKVLSFDRFDVVNNERVQHLPLFYIREYAALAADGAAPATDLLFLGSIHSDRYAVMQRVLAAARAAAPALRPYLHFYYQSRWVFALRKLFDRHFRRIPWNHVNWHSLDKQETLAHIARSAVLVDIHHPGQTGLTMRTIECVGARKKMITTNQDVVNYDFYRPENILVVDRAAPLVPAAFMSAPYVILPDEIYRRYSLKAWLNQIFS